MSQSTSSKRPASAPMLRRAAWRLAPLAAVVTLVAACTAAPVPVSEDNIGQMRFGDASKLINEGGPVFLLPGRLRLPKYYAGDASALTVRADRLDGGALTTVPEASVRNDETFSLKGRTTSNLFFATTEFTHDDSLHRVRALARTKSDAPIVMDAASSLMSAKIALAAQKRKLSDLNYQATVDLTDLVRTSLDAELGDVRLDQTNEALSNQLTTLAKPDRTLTRRLLDWERRLLPPTVPGTTTDASTAPVTLATPEMGDGRAEPSIEPSNVPK